MVLCVGPSGAGKTLLLRRLQDGQSSNDVVPTIPTVGSNLSTVNLGRRRSNTLIIRELGGAMAPIWSQYFNEASAVMYIVDAADNFQVAASTILLLDVLSHPDLQQCPFLLVFNKCDALGNTKGTDELKELMQLPAILRHAKQNVTVEQVSAKTKEGLQAIKDWLVVNTTGL